MANNYLRSRKAVIGLSREAREAHPAESENGRTLDPFLLIGILQVFERWRRIRQGDKLAADDMEIDVSREEGTKFQSFAVRSRAILDLGNHAEDAHGQPDYSYFDDALNGILEALDNTIQFESRWEIEGDVKPRIELFQRALNDINVPLSRLERGRGIANQFHEAMQEFDTSGKRAVRFRQDEAVNAKGRGGRLIPRWKQSVRRPRSTDLCG